MSPAGGARAAPSLLFSLLLGASAPLWLRAEKLGESGGKGRPGGFAPLPGAGSCPRPGERVRGAPGGPGGTVGCAQLTRLIPAAFIPALRSCEITAVTGLRASVSSRFPRPPLVGGVGSSWVSSSLLFPKSRQRGKVPGKLEARRLRPRGRPGSAPALIWHRRRGWDEDEDEDGDRDGDGDEDGAGAAAGAGAHSRCRLPPPRSPGCSPAASQGRAAPALAETKFGRDFAGIPQLGETRARELLCLPSVCVRLAVELLV